MSVMIIQISMLVGVVGYDLITILARVCVEEIDLMKLKYTCLEAGAKPAFQPRLPLILSENFRMSWDDSGGEQLAAYWAIETHKAFYRQDMYNYIIMRYY